MRFYEEGIATHFFWHWAEDRAPFRNFIPFMNSYFIELEKIMDVYIHKLTQGTLLPIIHLNELILYLLTCRERGHTACGVEMAKNYDVVSGKVFPCADLPSCLSIGELDKKGHLNLKEFDLKTLVKYKEQLGCLRCGVHFYCGGRCPVQVIAGSWERTLQLCHPQYT